MPLLISSQRSEEWLQARQKRITASVAAACLGKHPRMGPLAAYNQIMGITVFNGNKHTQWGIDHEDEALHAYEVEFGELVRPTGFWVHPKHNWLGASPDGLVGRDGLVEVKCPMVLPEKVPFHHVIQMAIQMACTGRKWCDYFAWCKPNHFWAKVTITDDTIRKWLDELYGWYQLHIATETPPKRARIKRALPADLEVSP